MRPASALALALLSIAAAAPSALADEPPPTQPPSSTSPGPGPGAPVSTPAVDDVPNAPAAMQQGPAASQQPTTASVASAPAATQQPASGELSIGAAKAARPRWLAGSWLLHAHLGAGFEPNPAFACKKLVPAMGSAPQQEGSSTCTVVAFGVGGDVMWRGFVGVGLGLYTSAGTPLVPGTATQAGLGDRISVTAALALRPLGLWAWNRGDSFTSRLAGGFGLELGPSVEYVRTSSSTLPNCDIGATQAKAGLHGQASLDVPLAGDSSSGWLSLRLAARMVVGSDFHLAPTQGQNETTCHSLVTEPGVAAQLFAGFSYYL